MRDNRDPELLAVAALSIRADGERLRDAIDRLGDTQEVPDWGTVHAGAVRARFNGKLQRAHQALRPSG